MHVRPPAQARPQRLVIERTRAGAGANAFRHDLAVDHEAKRKAIAPTCQSRGPALAGPSPTRSQAHPAPEDVVFCVATAVREFH
jgi:hypothetical protein